MQWTCSGLPSPALGRAPPLPTNENCAIVLKLKDHTAEALAQLKPLTVAAWWLVDTVDSSGLTLSS